MKGKEACAETRKGKGATGVPRESAFEESPLQPGSGSGGAKDQQVTSQPADQSAKHQDGAAGGGICYFRSARGETRQPVFVCVLV